MTEIALSDVCKFLDERLQTGRIDDYANALNGLQLENSGRVTRIAAAVDASLSTIDAAVREGCGLLIVHHGLFWSGLQPLTRNRYRLLKRALDGDLAVYSVHLPLDAGINGNSGLLVRAMGFDPGGWRPFFEAKGTMIGYRGTLDDPLERDELARRLSDAVVGGAVRVCPGGPASVRNIGVITGAAGSEARAVAEDGIDTLVTGEGPHWTYALAEELGINILYGGHYATETFGVRQLANDLEARFGLPWVFIDHPSGL